MASWRTRNTHWVFVCCLVAFLSALPGAYAADRKTAFALSHYIMALVYERANDIDAAIAEYRKALRADKGSAALHLGLASSYIRKNNIEKATEELNLAAAAAPQSIEPHAILALLYSAENKTSQAAKEYEIALQNASKLQPRNVDVYKTLGVFYLQQKRLPEALNSFTMILELTPADAEAHFYLGCIYDQRKDRGNAEAEFKKALQLRPGYPEALNYLGYFYVEQGKKLDEAEEMIKKALQIQPDNGAYVDSLGWLYFKKGKLAEALKYLEQASAMTDDPEILDHLGDAYMRTGDPAKAKASWQRSLQLDPGQAAVKKKSEAVR